MYDAPVRIDPRELQPGRGWFVAAGSIAGLLTLAGVGVFVLGLTSAFREIRIGEAFEAGQTVTVGMAPDTVDGIFARIPLSRPEPGGAGEQVPTPLATCTVTAPSGQGVPLSRPGASFTATVGGTAWRQIYVVDVPRAGDYRVTCRSNETSVFATGDDPDEAALFGWLFGGIAALVVLPGVGLGIAVVITIVVGRRRRDHRNRLIVERTGYYRR